MGEIINLDAWREILVRAFSELGSNIAGFLPNFVGATLILLLGWGVARVLEAIASRTLRTVGLDGVATRLSIADALERAGVRLTFSQLMAKLLFWLVMLTFLLSSVETLGLSAVTATIDRVVAYIPNVFGAVLISMGGMVLARFMSTLVSSGAAAAGIGSAPRIGFLAQMLIVGLAVVLAAEQLGIETSILVLPFTVALAVAGLAVGLAFALGARPVVTHIMAGHFLKQSLPRNVAIEIGGHRGLVERVGAVDTLIRGDDREWTVPNAQLLELVVVR